MGGKRQKKKISRKPRSNIETVSCDKAEDYFRNKYEDDDSNDEVKQVIKLSRANEAAGPNSDDEMAAMGLPSSRILNAALKADKVKAARKATSETDVCEGSDDASSDFNEYDGYEEESVVKEADGGMSIGRRSWGKKMSNYYETNVELDDEASSNCSSDAEMVEDEAIELQNENLKSLRTEDFELPALIEDSPSPVLEFNEQNEFSSLLNDFALKPADRIDLTQMSKEDIDLIIKRDHPELIGLLKEMKDKAQEINENLLPILQKIETKCLLTDEGLSYLEMKHHLLLCYLQYLLYYVLLKLHAQPVANHPVIERLVELKTLITQLRPLDKKLRPQIARLIAAHVPTSQLRPRPELMMGEEEEEEDENIEGSSEYEGEEGKKHLYKPPKLIAVDYAADVENSLKKKLNKEIERNEERLKKSEFIEALREEYQETPLELGDTHIQNASRRQVEKMIRKQMEQEAYEEENMKRINRSKSDKKAQSMLLRNSKKSISSLSNGCTLEDLASFADRAVDVTFDDPTIGTRKTTKLAESLSALRQATDNLERQKLASDKKRGDLHVVAKNVKRVKFSDDVVDKHFGHGDSTSIVEDVPDVVREALEKKEAKKRIREDNFRKLAAADPILEKTVEGKRAVSYQIEKNKGLTRKRKKIEGTSRVHYRQKFEKKMKKAKTLHQTLREPSSSGAYEGESSGIRTHLKKSVTIAS